MITLNGKYNSANVFIDTIDDATKTQIIGFLNNPVFSKGYIAIMPDCHAGKGSVIGFTMPLNNYIIPNIVGVDIGCGMLSVCLDNIDINLKELDDFIKSEIPHGSGINKKVSSENNFSIDISRLNEYANKVGADFEKCLLALGSLGGGNHFIELGKDSNNKIWLTIHSGSRNFGLKIATYYQNKAKENLKKYFIEDDKFKDLEFLLLDSDDGKEYLEMQNYAIEYALCNRFTIFKKICKFLNYTDNYYDIIHTIHNYIGKDNIIRKGATSALEGEKLVIPFNMRDGIALCVGKGCKKFNYSAPHGAGRILSRTKAMDTLSEETFENEMKEANIFTTTAKKDTLDEAPEAYKNKDVIIDNIKETVDIIDFIKPIYNFKAGN